MPFDMQILDTIVCARFRNAVHLVAAEAVGRTAANDNAASGQPGDDDLPPSGLLTLY